MYSLLLLGITSFLFSLLLTPLIRNAALHFGFVDSPSDRKTHHVPIPRLGGVAIFAATLASYAVLLLVGLNGGFIVKNSIPLALKLLPGVALIFGIGLADDIFNLSPWYKLFAQIAAAVLAWSSGIRLESLDGHPFNLVASFAVTVLWIVACSNAVNLIDGVDGLATGAGLFATITMLVAGALHGNMDLVFAITPVAAALLGFLRFNFSPASIFLGDCGSLGIGFLLGCFGIVWSEKAPTLLAMTAPLLALSVPLLDTAISIFRRFLRRQPIFGADRAHIHHKLLSRGLTPRRVVLLLYGFCGISAGTSILLTELHPRYQSFIIILVCLGAAMALRYLDYTEFRVASGMVLNGNIRRLVAEEIDLDVFARELAATEGFDKCWELICRNYVQFGFGRIELYCEQVKKVGNASNGWRVQIDFHNHGHMCLIRESHPASSGAASLLFVDCVSRIFGRKLDEFSRDQVIQAELESTEVVAANGTFSVE
jgi:UDP-GlcNAc:undecaprenyl-phosphate/decaprenyl-phosphate GlcNAc-1-phosphate transferase